MSQGAMTLAEGSHKSDFKTNACLILNGTEERKYILRTTFDPLSVWKSKYSAGTSPFEARINGAIREAAIIDGEIWVFGVDATVSKHIIDAVTIASQHYKIREEEILKNIYIKNMNAENEADFSLDFLVRLNKKLYKSTAEAIREACRYFGVTDNVQVHIYSHNRNPKIPQRDLHEALDSGGSSHVQTDPRRFEFTSGDNLGKASLSIKTNMHVAKFEF